MPGTVAAPAPDVAAAEGWPFSRAGFRRWLWAAAGAAAIVIGSGFLGFGGGVTLHGGLGANLGPDVAPAAAVSYIQSHGLTGHLFNDYIWGGYLIYKGIPVFVDGRDDLYLAGTRVFQDYVRATTLAVDPDAVLNKYGVQTVLMPKDTPLTTYLEAEPRKWRPVYSDSQAAVLCRVASK